MQLNNNSYNNKLIVLLNYVAKVMWEQNQNKSTQMEIVDQKAYPKLIIINIIMKIKI